MHSPKRASAERGVSMIELVLIVALIGVLLAMLMPAMESFYTQHSLDSAVTAVEGTVIRGRMEALKEKVPRRIVIRDDADPEPNRIELQQSVGGSWVEVANGTIDLTPGIDILSSSPYDSADVVDISERGQCTVSNVYLRSTDGEYRQLKVKTTCNVDEL